jgi:hypothetical protein
MSNGDSEQMKEDIRDIRNDIERIKSSTHNINRIMTLSNIDTIINDLKAIVGTSEKRAAILLLTKEKISAQELAEKVGLDRRNLPQYMAPLTDKKAYITVLKENGKVYYQRAEIIDLINFEKQEAFSSLIESWASKQSKKSEQVVQEDEQPQESVSSEEKV